MSERRDAIENTLSLHRACHEGVVWARKYATFEDAWAAIEAPDWMLWACETFGYRGERKLRLFAAACAARCQALWDDPQAARAVALAAKAGAGPVTADELRAELSATRRAAAAIVDRPDYSEAMAAAAAAITGALHDRAIEAAKAASRESARAIAWDPNQPSSWSEEAAWQSAELRALIGGESHDTIADIRKKNRGTLHVL